MTARDMVSLVTPPKKLKRTMRKRMKGRREGVMKREMRTQKSL